MASKLKLNEVVLQSPNGLVEKILSMGDDGIVKVDGKESATVESGSNANGSYVKYSDGTLICRHQLVTLFALNGNSETEIWTYPIAFNGVPNINITAAVAISDNPMFAFLSDNPNGSVSATQAKIRRYAPSAVPNYGSVSVVAIGRWK